MTTATMLLMPVMPLQFGLVQQKKTPGRNQQCGKQLFLRSFQRLSSNR
jgi:hypothetical protein